MTQRRPAMVRVLEDRTKERDRLIVERDALRLEVGKDAATIYDWTKRHDALLETVEAADDLLRAVDSGERVRIEYAATHYRDTRKAGAR